MRKERGGWRNLSFRAEDGLVENNQVFCRLATALSLMCTREKESERERERGIERERESERGNNCS